MNQRATHFTLGQTGQTYGSIYVRDYNAKKAQSNDVKVTNPFRGSSVNPSGPSSFSTTNKAMYKQWHNAQKNGLDAQKMKQLRGHHFKLGGYYPQNLSTTNKIFYDKKQLSNDASKNQQESKNKMRAHHHDFKQQPFTNFKSTYHQQYTQKQLSNNTNILKKSDQNAIVFGNNHLPMVTTNLSDYTKKQALTNNKRGIYQQTSALVLGQHSNDMKTVNQVYYDRKQFSKNQLPQSTMKELRATHFNLGGLPNQYARESDNYQKYSTGNLDFKIPQYQSGTWIPKDAKFQSNTTNQRQLPPREFKPYQKAKPINRGEFHLGNQGNYYATQFQRNFTQKQSNYAQPAQHPKGNIVIGSDKGYYQTEHKASYKNRVVGGQPVDNSGKYKDNVNIGGQLGHEAYITVYQDQYRQDQNKKSKLFHKVEPQN